MILSPTTEIALLKLFNGNPSPRDLETVADLHRKLHARSGVRAAFDQQSLNNGFMQEPRR